MPPGVEPLIRALWQYDQDAAFMRLRLEKRVEEAIAKPTTRNVDRVNRLRSELAALLWLIRRTERAMRFCRLARP